MNIRMCAYVYTRRNDSDGNRVRARERERSVGERVSLYARVYM